MFRAIQVATVGLLAIGLPVSAHGYSELTDAELDQVVAGAASAEGDADAVRFQFQSAGRRGRQVEGDGTLALRGGAPDLSGNLILRDSAQANLRSLVNVNAVNSPVQVLLNLNVNVNSTVGSLRQLNLSGRLQ